MSSDKYGAIRNERLFLMGVVVAAFEVSLIKVKLHLIFFFPFLISLFWFWKPVRKISALSLARQVGLHLAWTQFLSQSSFSTHPLP